MESQRLGVCALVVIFGSILPFICQVQAAEGKTGKNEELLVLTVATEETDGFKRFRQSAEKYNINVKVLGMGEKWEGGDVARFAGGGHKVNLLKDAMTEFKDNNQLVVMFVDSYDVVFSATTEQILSTFKKFDCQAVFSAEGFCWPDPSLADKYPIVKMSEKRYLNSGGWMAYAPVFYSIITHAKISNGDDDQLYYTQIFLDEAKREKLSMKLDSRGEIFQNLNGALDDVKLKFKGTNSFLYNLKTGVVPLIVHGNGPIKHEFNGLGNYLADSWTPTAGCTYCKEDKISIAQLPADDMPTVLMAILLETPTPFTEEFFKKIGALHYPKSNIDLFIHYSDAHHKKDVDEFLDSWGTKFNSVKVYGDTAALNHWQARNKALELCVALDCKYYFAVEAEAHLDNDETLMTLIENNRSVIAPLLVRPNKMWSNFWGALSADGFYKRSDDYIDIIQNKRRGQWNVPYITSAVLIHGYRVKQLLDAGGYIDGDLDPDMAFCKKFRDMGVFMYVDNQQYFGHLINNENYNTNHLHNDLYQIFDNPQDWEKKYIHPEYSGELVEGFENRQPCPDVYWFPIVTHTFADHLVEEVENFGEWSGGKHEDTRLAGGYENVPTVDIHMNQIEWERHWLHFLKTYIVPLAQKVFTGYYSDGSATMNFVVRYKPGEQDRLRPHHDASTYSINVALNHPGSDFEGGGTKFHRYNCSMTTSKKGWMLMHPGRLTHLHEGLPTTAGTRYIMVSFIDP